MSNNTDKKKEPRKFATVEAKKVEIRGAIIVALVGLIGTGIIATATYRSSLTPVKATQTAEAKFTEIALSATLTPSDTPQPIFTKTSTPTPTPTSTPMPIPMPSCILNHFRVFGYELHWTNANGTIGKTKITDVKIDQDIVTMKYVYENGALIGMLDGNSLSGTWREDSSDGNFELIFMPDCSSATGWWNRGYDKEPKPKFKYELK